MSENSLVRIKDLRNLLSHEYFGVNIEYILKTFRDDLPMLIDALQKNSEWN
ncbi:MAG: DUF86 domain-containing protein [Geobacter sp.]|nr:DUF86 domain-containing protein [Geobacter sp.]